MSAGASSSLSAVNGHNNMCRWTIECPVGEYVLFWQMDIDEPRNSFADRPALIFGDAMTNVSLWEEPYGQKHPSDYLSTTNRMFVLFQTLDLRNSFSLNFRCFGPGRCTSPNTTTTLTAPQGTIVSGSYGMPTGEQCGWTINCGTGNVVSFEEPSYTGGVSPILVKDAATDDLLIVLLRTDSKHLVNYLTNSQRVTVSFNGSTKASTTNTASFRLVYRCVPYSCQQTSSSKNCSVQLPPSAGCSSQEYFTPHTINNKQMPSNSSISFVDSSANTVIASYQPHTSSTATALKGASSVKVLWSVPAGAVQDNARFSVSYRCEPDPCRIGAPSGSYFAPATASGSEPLDPTKPRSSNVCSWTFQCPAGKTVIFKTANMIPSSMYTFLSPASNYTFLSRYGYAVDHQSANWNTNENVATVVYRGTQSSNPSTASLFRWYCGSAQCTSVNASNTVYRQREGRLVSGENGEEIGGSGQRCRWTVECPQGTVFSVPMLNLSSDLIFRISSSSPNTVHGKAPGDLLVQRPPTYFGGVQRELLTNRGLVTSASTAYISLDTDPSSITDYSFGLDWKCLEVTYNRTTSGGAAPPSRASPVAGVVQPLCSTTVPNPSLVPLTAQIFNHAAAPSVSADNATFPSVTVWPGNNEGGSFGPSGVGFTRQGTPVASSSINAPVNPTSNNTAAVQFVLSSQDDIFALQFACPPSGTNKCLDHVSPNPITGSHLGQFFRHAYSHTVSNCARMVSCPVGYTLKLFSRMYCSSSHTHCSTVTLWGGGLEMGLPSNLLMTSWLETSARGATLYRTTPARSYQHNYDMLYLCILGSCSSPNATESVYTAAEGRIVSRQSHSEWYFPGEECRWTVQCPRGTVFSAAVDFKGGYDVEGSVYVENQLLFYDVTLGSGSNRTWMVTFDWALSSAVIVSNASRVEFVYKAPGEDSGSYHEMMNSYELDYHCLPVSCQNSAGEVACDVQLPTCSSSVQPLFNLFYGKDAPAQVNLLPSITSRTPVMTYSSVVPSVPDRVLPTQSSFSVVSFRTPLGEGALQGYTFVYHCAAHTSCTSSGGVLTLADAAVERFHTPKSGECAWILQCATNSSVSCLAPLHRTSLFDVTPSSATYGLSLTTVDSSLRYGSTWTSLPNVTKLLVVGSSSSSDKCGCAFDGCTSVNMSTSVYTAVEGTILSDSDGAGAESYYDNFENCVWTVQCPVNHVFSAHLISDTEPGYDQLEFYDVSTGHKLRGHLGGRHYFYFYTNSSAVRVTFTSDLSVASRGFTLHYKCLPVSCKTPTRSVACMSTSDLQQYRQCTTSLSAFSPRELGAACRASSSVSLPSNSGSGCRVVGGWDWLPSTSDAIEPSCSYKNGNGGWARSYRCQDTFGGMDSVSFIAKPEAQDPYMLSISITCSYPDDHFYHSSVASFLVPTVLLVVALVVVCVVRRRRRLRARRTAATAELALNETSTTQYSAIAGESNKKTEVDEEKKEMKKKSDNRSLPTEEDMDEFTPFASVNVEPQNPREAPDCS